MDKKGFLPVLAVIGVITLPCSGAIAAPQSKTPPGGAIKVSPVRVHPAYQAHLTSGLQQTLARLPDANASAGVVIITFNTTGGLTAVTGLDTLISTLGINVAHRFESLGMISAVLTQGQITSLAANSSVRSLSDNRRLYYNLHQARVLCGVDKLRADAALTTQAGKVIDGSASSQIAVAVIDSGIDTTNTDLPFDMTTSQLNMVPTTGKVIQNVQVVGDSATGTITYAPNVPNTDSVAHGTHCAGIIGATGGLSRTTTATTGPTAGQTEDFSGVAGRFTGTSSADLAANPLTTASGVKIIGLGSGAALFVLDALGGFEYVIANQTKYNIRVTSNSYGSTGTYDPEDPLDIAMGQAYQRGITNVFAAGNSGPGSDTISSNSKSPYSLTVAAGTKEGGLASFSSRGLPANQRTGDATTSTGVHFNPNLYNLNAITAPGTGREFLFDAPYNPADPAGTFVAGVTASNPDTVGKKFYSDMISTLAKTGTAARGTNDQEFSMPYQANYTMISGTSMACPFVAGTCALLLSVNPSLTPAQIKNVLQATATHLPDYRDHEVGAGYVNVYAAVDMALNLGKPYKPFNRLEAPYSTGATPFITTINTAPLAAPGRPATFPPATVTQGAGMDEDFTLPYNPQSVAAADYAGAVTKAKTNNNSYAFLVDATATGMPNSGLPPSLKTTELDVRVQFGQGDFSSIAGGNSIGILLWAPDGTSYSSGIALPVLDSPTREVLVKAPIPGLWVVEFRGLRGLAAVPVTPPTGLGLPDTVTGQIYRTNGTVLNPPSDIGGIGQNAAITTALLNHYFDQVSSGTFSPSSPVTRAVFAQVLADNIPLRQSLAGTASPYSDLSGDLARSAQASAQSGSSLRDWDFTPGPTLPSNPTQFSPAINVSRSQVAITFVRALGLDPEAQHLAGTAVKVPYQGNMITVTDALLLSPAQRGYLQMALNRGLINFLVQFDSATGTYTAISTPTKNVTRADLATVLVNFRTIFPKGNSLLPTEYTPQPN